MNIEVVVSGIALLAAGASAFLNQSMKAMIGPLKVRVDFLEAATEEHKEFRAAFEELKKALNDITRRLTILETLLKQIADRESLS